MFLFVMRDAIEAPRAAKVGDAQAGNHVAIQRLSALVLRYSARRWIQVM